MAQRKTLTQAQLDLLQWVSDGCPDGAYEGTDHRISAAALHRRGLVEVSGRRQNWEAVITPAGKDYLAKSKEPGAEPPRRPNVSATEQLIRDVDAAGGTLRIGQQLDPGPVDWEDRVRATVAQGKVPVGMELLFRQVGDAVEIRLVDLPPELDPRRLAVPVPKRVARYHPVAKRFRDSSDLHEVSRAQLGRATRIVQALVAIGEERGWEIRNVAATKEPGRYGRSNWTGANDGHIVVRIGDYSQWLQIREDGLPSRASWEKEVRRSRPHWDDGPRHEPLGEYEKKATGHLSIVMGPKYGGRSWSDRKSWSLDEKLPEIVLALEAAATEHRRRAEEAEKQAALRRERWEEAMERARERYLEAWRADKLIRRAETLRQVKELREYCDAVEAQFLLAEHPRTAEWIEWARRYLERVDPLRDPPVMPADPDDVRPEDLKPFLDGWSPYGPEAWR